MRISVFVVAAALLTVGCSSSKTPPPQAQVQTPPPAEKTVFDTQLKALDKAKAVQGVVDKQAQDTDKKLDDAGG